MAILITSRLYNKKLRMIHEINSGWFTNLIHQWNPADQVEEAGCPWPLTCHVKGASCIQLVLACQHDVTHYWPKKVLELFILGQTWIMTMKMLQDLSRLRYFLHFKKLCLKESKLCLTEFRDEGLRKPMHPVVIRGCRLPQIQISYSQAERNRSRQAGMRRRDEVKHIGVACLSLKLNEA